jgi:phenylalanyl-tRNA synthetase beta chain
VPEGKISLAFRLSYQRGDRTLTDEEVTKRVEALVRMLRERFGATLRAQGGSQ